MRPIDSLLRILVLKGGTELRLASDRRPQMFKDGEELPLTILAMPTDRIRELLDDLWIAHEAEVRERGQCSFSYRNPELGTFAVDVKQPTATDVEVRVRVDRDGVSAADGAAQHSHEPSADDRGVTIPGVDHGNAPAALVDLLTRAARRGVSDVHVGAGRVPVVRVDGALVELDGESALDPRTLLDESARERVSAGGSVDRGFDVPGVGRVRVNVYASLGGLCAAVRILAREVPVLSELHLPPNVAALADFPHGLVIACGPTGSGKSTTLAALIEHALRARPQVLITLEDPIEYLIRPMHSAGLVRQREVGTHVRDFATGLRDALRENPDLLLVGEMRDPETINLALTAAETGHLVFASLHSRTAASAVERIVDAYPPERQRQIRVQLADALRAVVSQRLVPTSHGDGRVPAVELLRVTHGVANLIREGRTPQIATAIQAGAADGMMVLEQSLADLVRAGRIRRESALAVANDPTMLHERLRALA